MFQELLFNGSSVPTISSSYSDVGERKNKAQINNNNNNNISGIIVEATTATTATKNPSDKANGNNNSEQNLRCPRCDSSNTKFCYYNNYNLTQPRHFCKTCRRYWTKGGALRNVPIGGGCRKNKPSFTGKPKTYSSSADILLKSGLLDNSHESSLHQHVTWSSPPQPQTSHLMAFLRSTQNPNPSNHTYLISSSHLQNSSQNDQPGFTTTMNLQNSQPTSLSGFDYPCISFFGNKNQTLITPTHHLHLQQVPDQQRSEAGRGVHQQNSGIQELYQRMNLSITNSNTNSYSIGGTTDTNHHAHVVLGNGVSVSSSPTFSRPIVESAQVTLVGGSGISNSGLWNGTTQRDYSTWTNDHHLPGATN